MKLCTQCNINKDLNQFSKKLSSLRNSCKSCDKQYKHKNKDRISKYNKKYATTNSGKFNSMKKSAKRRGLPCEITQEEFNNILKAKICFYCDSSIENTGGSSLNRIDSSKGYSIDNVKPCCSACNYIMLDFSIEDLSTRVYKIVNRMKVARAWRECILLHQPTKP